MNRWAALSNNSVTTVVEQGEKPDVFEDNWIECPDWVSPLDTYDPATNTFTKFVPPPPPKIITKLDMITRFTDDEYTGVLSAAKTDVQVQGWLDRLYAAISIDLEDSRTISGINLLVSKNLLTQERANHILTDPIAS